MALLAVILALLLAGCGGAGAIGGAGGASSGGGTTAPAPTRTSRVGTGRPQPCKGTPTPPSAPPSVTLRSGPGARPVTAPVGSIVEIRLSGENVWNLSKITPAGGLTPSGAQGALEQGDCVWDFAVAQAGDVTVSFVGTAICLPDVACPAYAILVEFTIHGV